MTKWILSKQDVMGAPQDDRIEMGRFSQRIYSLLCFLTCGGQTLGKILFGKFATIVKILGNKFGLLELFLT